MSAAISSTFFTVVSTLYSQDVYSCTSLWYNHKGKADLFHIPQKKPTLEQSCSLGLLISSSTWNVAVLYPLLFGQQPGNIVNFESAERRKETLCNGECYGLLGFPKNFPLLFLFLIDFNTISSIHLSKAIYVKRWEELDKNSNLQKLPQKSIENNNTCMGNKIWGSALFSLLPQRLFIPHIPCSFDWLKETKSETAIGKKTFRDFIACN